MKVAIIGSNGQLGSDLYREFSLLDYDVIPLTHKDIEISNYQLVKEVFLDLKPNIILNTSALHNVPLCETNKEEAFNVNSLGAKYLSDIANKISATLVHFSTDYVFNGNKNLPYIESDVPNPLNIYGLSKVEGEEWIKKITKKFYILRVAALYGDTPPRIKGYNFITLMLKLAKEKDELRVVDDEITTPTWTKEVVRQLLTILKSEPEYGLYHATAEGSCSWYEFAKVIFEIKKIKVNLKNVKSEEFKSTVKRPKYSVLENKNLKDKDINIFKQWDESLVEYLNTREKL